VAGPADVVACYRLLLGRPPDPAGLAHWLDRLGGGVPVGQVVEAFLGSVEFARAHPAHAGTGTAVETVTTAEGFRMHVDATDYAVGHTIARTGAYEPDVTAVLRRRLGPGQTFVDVGANVGWFSLLAASIVGPRGTVVAVEPNPRNVALLEASARDNGFGNIRVANVALAERPMPVALETDGSNGRVIPVDTPPASPVRASYVVAARPLDDVLEGLGVGHVDVVKVDVEGAEPLVLLGGHRTFASPPPILVTEFYPLALDSSPWGGARRYLSQLRERGYRLDIIGGEEDVSDGAVLSRAVEDGRDHVDLLAYAAAGGP
jgi:FkbM family methyltransferase